MQWNDCTLVLMTCLQDDRFIAKEISKAELQAMEAFAPAYFDYMSSAISANVMLFLKPRLFANIKSSASNPSRQSFWMLQAHIQKNRTEQSFRQNEVDANEPCCHGESVL